MLSRCIRAGRFSSWGVAKATRLKEQRSQHFVYLVEEWKEKKILASWRERQQVWSWRDGSVVRGTERSSREPTWQSITIPYASSRGPDALYGLHWYWMQVVYIHTCMQTPMYIYRYVQQVNFLCPNYGEYNQDIESKVSREENTVRSLVPCT